MSFQIAIDGPAGAGKSTVAKAVAEKLGFLYVDTGAMYRAMGLFFLDQGTDTNEEKEINRSVKQAEVSLQLQGGVQHVYLNGTDVTGRIRTEEAGMMASQTSAYQAVREKLVRTQKKIAQSQNVVMDGRDIGTVVLPKAQLKIFLTASVETRARRRFLELTEKGQNPDLAEIEKDIEQRDDQDRNRKISPLRQAEDAVLLDSSDLTAAQVTEKIVRMAKEKMQ